jgi:hypothetical protein
MTDFDSLFSLSPKFPKDIDNDSDEDNLEDKDNNEE